MSWINAVGYVAAYNDGTNTVYRLITKAEALEILTNNDLLSQLGLTGNENFWTIEEIDIDNAYVFAGTPNNVYSEDKDISHGVFPIRKVNFYGLPLIESEFGGGLVYDVVAETRTVNIVAEWADVLGYGNGGLLLTWEDAILEVPTIYEYTYEALPTRAQALKIFGNSYLVTLAGLPVDNDYWTSEEEDLGNAYSYDIGLGVIDSDLKTELFYALPVRSEVVPEA